MFQSYQDDERLIMKGCVQWSSVYGWEDFASSGHRTWSTRLVGQRLTHWATGAPFTDSYNVYTFLVDTVVLQMNYPHLKTQIARHIQPMQK